MVTASVLMGTAIPLFFQHLYSLTIINVQLTIVLSQIITRS